MAEQPANMPVVFIGHGAPTLVLSDNRYTRAWRQLAQTLPHPEAIVVVSAHWQTQGKTSVTAMLKPPTLHDFGRMDDRLSDCVENLALQGGDGQRGWHSRRMFGVVNNITSVSDVSSR